MSKYDYPGERLFGARCETCDKPLYRDTDDVLWCPRCSQRQKIMQAIRRRPRKGTDHVHEQK